MTRLLSLADSLALAKLLAPWHRNIPAPGDSCNRGGACDGSCKRLEGAPRAHTVKGGDDGAR